MLSSHCKSSPGLFHVGTGLQALRKGKMECTVSVIYRLSLLLFFEYLVMYHFPQMTSSTSASASASPNDPNPNDQVKELDPEKFYHHSV